jgi:hypothetical protein
LGSFNSRCAVTDINIQPGEPVQIFRLRPNKYADGAYYPHSFFEPDCFPVSATYDDYGFFTDVELKPVNRLALPIITDSEEQKDTFFAVHKVIYDHMSKPVPVNSMFDEMWFENKRHKHTVKLWQKVVDKHIDRMVNLEKMFEALKTNPDYKTVRAQFPDSIYATTEEFRNLPFKSHDMDMAFFKEPTLATEIFEYKNFWINMYEMNKNFRPSSYANQQDNYEIYKDHLIPLMQKICKQKDDFWEETR